MVLPKRKVAADSGRGGVGGVRGVILLQPLTPPEAVAPPFSPTPCAAPALPEAARCHVSSNPRN